MLTSPARLSVLALVVSLAALFALPQNCFACSCDRLKPPLEAAGDADAVFRAQVIAVERINGQQRAQYQRARVRVTTVWKGTVTAETILYTGSGGGDCGFTFQPGAEYVIYAYAVPDATDWPPGALATSICTRTRPVNQADDDLAALGPGQPPMPGLPNTGAGAAPTPAVGPLVPEGLVIAGSLLALLANARRGHRPARRP